MEDVYTLLNNYISTHLNNDNSCYRTDKSEGPMGISIPKHELKDFESILQHSYNYEEDELTDEIKKNMKDYMMSLRKHEPPDVLKMMKIMDISDGIRKKEDVFINLNTIGGCAYSLIQTANHIGMNPYDLDIKYIQGMINEFYENLNKNEIILDDIIKGFELYIKFERIHPFLDGNGRLGRLIFLEHPFNYYMFPFSTILRVLGIKQRTLFYKYSIPYDSRTYNESVNSKDKYLDFKIDDETKFEICKIIYKCVCYSQFKIIKENYIASIRLILQTKYEDLYKLSKNEKYCYSIEEILTVVDYKLHNLLIN